MYRQGFCARRNIQRLESDNSDGRKSKYESHVEPSLFEIEHWARDGLIEEEICKRLGVGDSTFNEYKLKYLELTEALKKERGLSDYEVENALFKKATGDEFEERTYLSRINGESRN